MKQTSLPMHLYFFKSYINQINNNNNSDNVNFTHHDTTLHLKVKTIKTIGPQIITRLSGYTSI